MSKLIIFINTFVNYYYNNYIYLFLIIYIANIYYIKIYLLVKLKYINLALSQSFKKFMQDMK